MLGFVERFINAGDVVWDIGANMGCFTLPAAHKGAKVVAFEPDPFNQRLLSATIADNPDVDLALAPVAVGERDGTTGLRIARRGRSCNSLVGAQAGYDMGGVREVIPVQSMTIDSAANAFGAPDFIKCDAEGAEAMILRGAARTLRDCRPLLEIEMSAENAQECRSLLADADYRLFDALQPVTQEIGAETPWEVLAIPAERVAECLGK